MSEDSIRRAFSKMDESAGVAWLQQHLDYCVAPLLGERWILDIDSTVKPLYGHQEGAGGRLQSEETRPPFSC